MKNSTIVWIVVIVLIIIGGIWWWSASSTPAPAATSGTMIPEGYTVGETNSSTSGEYLVNTNGMALYTYASDTSGVSNCTGTCATTWLPYTVASGTSLTEESSVTGTLATITRSDGTTQVTYNGAPLYTYSGDTGSGQTNGVGMSGWALAAP
jgi:predicted lipoprotein with Yx(FWY)xxD motif